jgi:hypothetical protein
MPAAIWVLPTPPVPDKTCPDACCNTTAPSAWDICSTIAVRGWKADATAGGDPATTGQVNDRRGITTVAWSPIAPIVPPETLTERAVSAAGYGSGLSTPVTSDPAAVQEQKLC